MYPCTYVPVGVCSVCSQILTSHEVTAVPAHCHLKLGRELTLPLAPVSLDGLRPAFCGVLRWDWSCGGVQSSCTL